MKEVNFWETTFFKDNYQVLTKDEFKKELEENDYNLIVASSFTPSKNPFLDYNIYSTIERKVKQLQITLNYTNEDYPIIKENRENGNIVINPDFLLQNKDEILTCYYDLLKRQKNTYVTICRELFDNERFYNLIKGSVNVSFNLKINLDELSYENKCYLDDNFINYTVNDVKNNNYLVSDYKLSDLSKDYLYLKAQDILFSFDKVKYFNDNVVIELKDSKDKDINFKAYSHLIALLEKENKKSTVIIDKTLVGDVINQVDFDLLNLQSVKIKIYDGFSLYNKGYYLNREDYLDFLVKNIKNSKLSPFERYMQLYNEIGKSKPFKDEVTREKKHSLVNDNFTEMLLTLTKKVGISSINLGGNKILVNIFDPKYDLDGYYVSYTSWDKISNDDVQEGALICLKDADKLGDIDYIFNVKNMNDFSLKVNELIDKKSSLKYDKITSTLEFSFKNERGHQKHSRIESQVEKEAIKDIFDFVMEIFRLLDYNTYFTFMKKYAYLAVIDTDIEDYYAFLTDLGMHVTKHISKPVNSEHAFTAAVCSKIQSSTLEEKKEIKEIIQSIK